MIGIKATPCYAGGIPQLFLNKRIHEKKETIEDKQRMKIDIFTEFNIKPITAKK